MMTEFLRDALIDLLFAHMVVHIDRGLDYDEALLLGVAEIRHQIRESRGDVAAMLISQAVSDARHAHDLYARMLHEREHETARLH